MSDLDQDAVECVTQELCVLSLTAGWHHDDERELAETAIKAHLEYLDAAGFAVVRKGSVPDWLEKVDFTDFYTRHDGPMTGLPVDSLYRFKDES